jgi:hypothetical protein
MWPGANILMHDVDRHAPPGVVEELAIRTGISVGDILGMILPSVEGCLLEGIPPGSGWVQWILAISLRGRASHGIQYCPECLAEDDEPHWRLAWRLAFVTTCSRHRRVLKDACSFCGKAPNPLALLKGQRPSTEPAPVTCCRWCGEDFRNQDNGLSGSECPSVEVINFEIWLLKVLEGRWADLHGHGLIHSVPFFRGLHLVLTMLTSKGQPGRLRHVVRDRVDVACPELLFQTRARGMIFERQPVDLRHNLMVMAAWLLDKWPHRFITACREASLSGARLTLELQRGAPYWYWKVADEYLGLRCARWRRSTLPDGMSLSYNTIGRRLSSRKLIAQERRIRYIRDHPELWGDYLRLVSTMQKAGLYSQKSPPSVLMRYLPTLIKLAKGEGVVHRLVGPLIVSCLDGKRQVVMLPFPTAGHELP